MRNLIGMRPFKIPHPSGGCLDKAITLLPASTITQLSLSSGKTEEKKELELKSISPSLFYHIKWYWGEKQR